MSVNSDDFTHPEQVSQVSFSPQEWAKAKKAIEKIRERLAATVNHIIKSDEPRKRPDFNKKKRKLNLGDVDEKLKAVEREARGFDDEE